MEYFCAKFGDFGLSRFGFVVRTDRQTDRQTESHTERDAAKRLSHATTGELSQVCTGSAAYG